MNKTLLNKGVEYDSELDSLHIYKNKGKDIIGSITLGNFILDVDIDGSIVGLEIDNASEVLGIEPSLLSESKEGIIEVFVQNKVLIIRYRLIYGKAQHHSGMCAIPQNKIAITS